MWRVESLQPTSTIGDLKQDVEQNHGVPTSEQSIHMDRSCKDKPLASSNTLRSLKLRHGSMLYIAFDTAKVNVLEQSTKRVIAEDGSLVAATSSDSSDRNAVRPGLMSLRSRKLHWTMDELMQIEAGYTFKIQRQDKAICQGVSLDRDMCNDFQQYVRQLGFTQTRRCAWLYGRYVEKLEQSKVDEEAGPAVDSFGKKLKVRVRAKGYGGQTSVQVQVDCSYEPPQRCTGDTMELLEDPHEDLVNSVATSLGLEKVGFMFSHPGPREEGHHFSANEIIMCAENQLLAGDEAMQSPFITVKVTLNENNESDFQAYQMSKQCLELVAEGALLYDTNEPRGCLIHDTFSCLVEAKEVSRVDNDYFLALVPIMDHQGKALLNTTKCPVESVLFSSFFLRELLFFF